MLELNYRHLPPALAVAVALAFGAAVGCSSATQKPDDSGPLTEAPG